jgi:hypothetical protein
MNLTEFKCRSGFRYRFRFVTSGLVTQYFSGIIACVFLYFCVFFWAPIQVNKSLNCCIQQDGIWLALYFEMCRNSGTLLRRNARNQCKHFIVEGFRIIQSNVFHVGAGTDQPTILYYPVFCRKRVLVSTAFHCSLNGNQPEKHNFVTSGYSGW